MSAMLSGELTVGETHHSFDYSNPPPELMPEPPGNLLVEFCKGATSRIREPFHGVRVSS
jgi:hypothetical protein